MTTIRLTLLWAPLVICQIANATPAESQTLRYTIISNGRVAGSEVDTYSADGRVESTFEFNDRGRGPKVNATYTLDTNGYPLKVDLTGARST